MNEKITRKKFLQGFATFISVAAVGIPLPKFDGIEPGDEVEETKEVKSTAESHVHYDDVYFLDGGVSIGAPGTTYAVWESTL